MADDAPYVSEFSLILHYSPEMVAELAMGAEHPHEIAERYGVDVVDYEHLAAQEWFGRLVALKRTEFHEQGVLFTAKAGMMAEALLTRLFQQSMAGVINAALTIDVAKQLVDIGRLKPQPLNTQPGQAGGAFQINIQVNGSDVIHTRPNLVPAPASTPVSPTAAQVDGVATVVPDMPTGAALPPTMALDFVPPKGKPPATISGLRVPGFDMRPTGVGLPTPNAAAFGQPLPTSTKPA